MTHPTEKQAYAQGHEAAEATAPNKRPVCPYEFGQVSQRGVTQEAFDRDYRHLMAAWYRGWMDTRQRRGDSSASGVSASPEHTKPQETPRG